MMLHSDPPRSLVDDAELDNNDVELNPPTDSGDAGEEISDVTSDDTPYDE